MLLADRRFGLSGKHAKLPRWLKDCLSDASLSLSVEEAVDAVFYRRVQTSVQNVTLNKFFKRGTSYHFEP